MLIYNVEIKLEFSVVKIWKKERLSGLKFLYFITSERPFFLSISVWYNIIPKDREMENRKNSSLFSAKVLPKKNMKDK